MNIGLVGYFGFGNYGDELFLSVWNELFKGHKLIIFHDPEKNTLLPNFDDLVDQVDVIVIGGGDLLIPWHRSWLYWEDAFLRKPVHIYGIGVPTWSKNDPVVLDHYRMFLNHPNVCSISCRDIESVNWVNDNISIKDKIVTFYPDLVFSYDFKFYQSSVASKTVGLVLRSQPSYDNNNILSLVEHIQQSGYTVKLIMLGTGSTLNDDLQLIDQFNFHSVPIIVRDTISDLTEVLTECSYVVSQKFHGCVVAYLNRIPFIMLSGADKFVSFGKMVCAQEFISWDSDPNLIPKFDKLISSKMDYSNLEMFVTRSREGLGLLKERIESSLL